MHLNCCAHIINLIINDGLKEVDCSVTRVTYKFVKSYLLRLTTFKRCAKGYFFTLKDMNLIYFNFQTIKCVNFLFLLSA